MSTGTGSAISIRRRLLLLLLPALLLLMVAGAFVNYRAAVLVARSGGEPLHTVSRHLILVTIWLTGFIQVDVTLLLVWIAVHYGLKPLTSVRMQIEARSPRDLEPLRTDAVPTEVRPLADALNLLFDMLREAVRSQRQFVADTAHQLRTPIAGLMGQLELLMGDPEAAPVRARLAALHGGMSRLAHSANQLLAMARADRSASLADRFEAIELRTLVEKAVELHVNRAERQEQDLGADAHPAVVEGSRRLLEDLLNNLIDNALSYTQAGARITARCGTGDTGSFLEVEDDGPGIPESERGRVRQRFYRIAGSPGVGCGLGLAIVDEIARLHDAALTIESGSAGRGTRVRIQFAPPGRAPPGRAMPGRTPPGQATPGGARPGGAKRSASATEP